jgi:hypothetical protein
VKRILGKRAAQEKGLVSHRSGILLSSETKGEESSSLTVLQKGAPSQVGGLVPELEDHVPYLIAPFLPDDPPLKTADSLAIPAKKRVRSSMLWALSARRRATAKPWLAPIAADGSVEITLAEKNRLFNSRKVKDLWQLFYDFRADFPRPEESDRVRSLCMSWKTKHKSHSPRVLPRFFKKHPELALWAIWVERAIHETPTRSAKNQFPQVDLLRKCLEILGRPQVQRLTGQKRCLDEPKNSS